MVNSVTQDTPTNLCELEKTEQSRRKHPGTRHKPQSVPIHTMYTDRIALL